MLVRKILQILTDQEEVKQLFVDGLEPGDGPPGLGVKDAEFQRDLAPGWNGAGNGAKVDWILNGHGQPGHQLHAAARAGARSLGAHLAVHGADEIRLLRVQ